MKKNKFRGLITLLCGVALCCGVGAFASGCSKEEPVDLEIYVGEDEFVKDEVKPGPQFLEGALTDIKVGETLLLNEYVQYEEGANYTITITDEEENETDVTDEFYWLAEKFGNYTMTYKISSGRNSGTSTLNFTVSYPELTWEYTLQYLPYLYGQTMNFEEYFGEMNIFTSLENCEVKMDSVEVDDMEYDLSEMEEYTFASRSDHTFKFHVEAPDGQTREGREVISIKYLDPAYQQELTDMGIELYGELYVEKGKYTTMEGTYHNDNNVILKRENGPHNLPYIAYQGNYGIDSYVKVDFTGKNMPILSFFRGNDYSPSVFDGTKGIVYTGGFNNNNGVPVDQTVTSRATLYGPYMLHYYDNDAPDAYRLQNMTSSEGAYPGSLRSLDDNTRYRMIAGFSKIEKGTAAHKFTKETVDTLFLTFDCAIINLDTNELFNRFQMRTYGIQALDFGEIPLDTENNPFFTGNIVMYGNYGIRTVIDGIYPIITDKTFEQLAEEELSVSSFKTGVKTFFYNPEEVLKVSDYVDTSKEGYRFFYANEAGEIVNVTEETFVLGKTGRYVFYYSDGKNLSAKLNVFVGEYSDALVDWLKENKMNLYGVDNITENHGVVLNASTIGNGANYMGPNTGDLIDQSYVGFDGEYGFNSYVAFDFTGKNMPSVAFFAKNYNNSMYYQDGGKQGLMVMTGLTNSQGNIYTGTVADRYNMYNGKGVIICGPSMIHSSNKVGANGTLDFNGKKIVISNKDVASNQDVALGRANLDDNTQYRVIMGMMNGGDNKSITLAYRLYDLTNGGKLVEEFSATTWGYFVDGFIEEGKSMRQSCVGSIVLYGHFGMTTTLDALHGVYEDNTLDGVCAALGMAN